MIKLKRDQSWKQGEITHEPIGSLWSGFLTMNLVLPIWKNYDGLMVLFVRGVILSQSLGTKLVGDWFVPDVATKHQ